MSGISIKDLQMHEARGSEVLSEIRGGKRSTGYPIGSSFKPFILGSALRGTTIAAPESFVEQQSYIDNDGVMNTGAP